MLAWKKCFGLSRFPFPYSGCHRRHYVSAGTIRISSTVLDILQMGANLLLLAQIGRVLYMMERRGINLGNCLQRMVTRAAYMLLVGVLTVNR